MSQIDDEGLVALTELGIANLSGKLRHLSLHLSSCKDVTDVGLKVLIEKGIRVLSGIKSLALHFGESQLSDVTLKELAEKGFVNIKETLQELKVSFWGCRNFTIRGYKYLSRGIGELKNLLDLKFHCWYSGITNEGLEAIAELGISQLEILQSLVLDFHDTRAITDIGFSQLAEKGIANLKNLEKLSFDLYFCGISDLGLNALAERGLKSLGSLQYVAMDCSGTGITKKAASNFYESYKSSLLDLQLILSEYAK